MTIASQTEGARAGGFMIPPRDNRCAFRAAVRHSRLVRILRVGIPLSIVLAVTALAAYQWIDPMRVLARVPISTDGMVISGSKVIMRQPRLTGYTKDERPYTLTARTAARDLANPDVLEMEDIRTSIVMQDGRKVEVTAREGLYDAKADTIRLQHNVVVSSADYEVLLHDALVHVKAGSVVSEQPVEVKMLQGTLTADRIEVAESGAVIRFERNVTLILDGDVAPSITGAVQ
ncbi:MAG: LPS export ABC transporter periplasmic protein LptC [Rhizobiales bacterium]|nr:LPS export ABC transporter periplasmic protein LptC [Hyphomicrobiales bacterium]